MRQLRRLALVAAAILLIGCQTSNTALMITATADPFVPMPDIPTETATVVSTVKPTFLPTATPFPTLPVATFDDDTLPDGAVARIGTESLGRSIQSHDGTFYISVERHRLTRYESTTDSLAWSVYLGESVAASKISADDRYMAVGNHVGDILVFDTATGELVRQKQHVGAPVRNIEWSPAANELAIALLRNQVYDTISVWDVQVDQIILESHEKDYDGFRLLWSTDGSTLIASQSAGISDDNSIAVWDMRTRTLKHTLIWGKADGSRGPEGPVSFMHLSPNESALLAIYALEGGDFSYFYDTAILWDLETGSVIHELEYVGLYNAVFSPDGKQIAVAERASYYDDVERAGVTIWNTDSGDVVTSLKPSGDLEVNYPIWDTAWSPNGTLIASIINRRLLIWDASTYELIRELDGSVSQISWSEDSQEITSAGTTWDVASGAVISTQDQRGPTEPGRVVDLEWSPDGRTLATASFDGIGLWNMARLESGVTALPTDFVLEQIYPTEEPAELFSIALSPDGRKLASASGWFNGSISKQVAIWDFASGNLLTNITGIDYAPLCIEWSPDGTKLAWVDSNFATVWDVDTHSTLWSAKGNFEAVAWSPDGSLLALGQGIGVEFVNAKTGELIRAVHLGMTVYSFAWMPDNQKIAVGGRATEGYPSGAIAIVDVESGEVVKRLNGQEGGVTSVAWSQDGSQLAASGGTPAWFFEGIGPGPGQSDGSLVLWDVASGEVAQLLAGHASEVQAVAFSPDGSLLASGSLDGTVIIWQVK